MRFQGSTLETKYAKGLADAWPPEGDPGGGAPLPTKGDSPEAMFCGQALVQLLRRTAPKLPLLKGLQADYPS